MKHTLYREIEAVDFDVEVEVEYIAHPAYKGRCDSIGNGFDNGPKLEPDEPAYIEITSAKDASGVEWELTSEEQENIEILIAEELSFRPDDDWRDDR